MDAIGGLWGFGVVLIGGFFLGGVIIWSILQNRKSSPKDIDRTEHATHDMYKAQDAADKHLNHEDKGDGVAN